MTLSGNVDALATRVAQEFQSVRAEMGSGSLGGWIDCSQMTTAAAINAAAAAAPPGSTIWLGARDWDNPLVVETTLIVRPQQRWLGAGGREILTVIQAGPTLPTGQPMMAAEGYMEDAGDADDPISVQGILFDLATSTGSHGLVVYNFWSHFEDLQFTGGSGAGTYQLLAADVTIGDVTTTNSHSENTFVRLRFDNTTNGAGGFYGQCQSGIANQDGHLTDSFFSAISGTALELERAAGWTIENNHFYGIEESAIVAVNCYATKVIGNYIEDFGGADEAGGYYFGIMMDNVLDTRGSVVANNTVSSLQPESPVAEMYGCIGARAGYGQKSANIVVSGNTLVFANLEYDDEVDGPAVKKTTGFAFGDASDVTTGEEGRMLYVEYGTNQMDPSHVTWFDELISTQVTVTISQPLTTAVIGAANGAASLGSDGRLVATELPLVPTGTASGSGGAGTLSTDASIGANVRLFTATGDQTIAVPTNGVNGQVIRYRILANASGVDISFNSGIRTTTGITRGPYAVPQNQYAIFALECISGTVWALTAFTITAS